MSAPHALPALVRPVATPALYETEIRHVRSAPIRHDFTYRSAWWLIDLDDVPVPTAMASFEAGDHCGDPALSLRENVDAFLAEHGVDLAGGQVVLLCSARSFGHAFNPLSVYWCHHRDGTPACVIAEVHNTYGGRHRSLVHTDEHGRARVDKALYVSPFYDVSGKYRLTLPVPDDEVRLTVALHRRGEPAFVASVRGRRRSVTRGAVWRAATLGSSWRTSALIRRQGIALWLRGAKVQPR